ncbi:MAG: hypothetical protein QUS14_01090 [Pyrinomonadaceae bacterium]|nr:hypothetical protein [Pyrinomonadaceae bacterium]
MNISIAKISVLALIFALSLLVSGAAAQSAAYTDGTTSRIPSDKLSELKKLNAAIAVPTYVPAGFKFDSLELEEPPAPGILFFTIVYRHSNGKSFAIQSANDGIGDVSESELFGRNPYFADRIAAGYSQDEEKSLFVSWMATKKRYEPKGSLTQYYSLVADKGDITLRESIKVMASLRYLKK